MSNILKNVNNMVVSMIAETYNAERIIKGVISEQGRYLPDETEHFKVRGNFQPYNPRFVHSHIVKEELGDRMEYLKLFYPTNVKKYKLDYEDVIEYNNYKWIVVGIPDFTKHGTISYILKLGGSYANKRFE